MNPHPINTDNKCKDLIVNSLNDNSNSHYLVQISEESSWQLPHFTEDNAVQDPNINSSSQPNHSSSLDPNISGDIAIAINPQCENIAAQIKPTDISQSFQFGSTSTYDIPYLLSTPTKISNSESTFVDISDIDMLHTPKKDAPENCTLPFHSFQLGNTIIQEPTSLFLITHSTPPKRRLAPKLASVHKGAKVSPLLKKYRKMSPKKTPSKLKFILPKQRQIKIKRHVLKCKPPKDNIIPSTDGDVEDILATPFSDDLFKEDSGDHHCDKNSIDEEEDDILGEEEEMDYEDYNITTQQEEHLSALFKASSTIAEKQQNERRNNGGQKLNKQQRRLQARIAALNCCDNEPEDNTNIAINFIKRAKELLSQDPLIFSNLICTLQDFDSSGEIPESLYFKVAKIVEQFPQITNEFVMFLKPHQAMKIGKYREYCAGLRLRDFVQKLKHLYGDNQLQMQKLVKLIQIMQNNDMSNKDMEDIKAKVAPVLRYPHLLENFAQCFSSEPPPPSLDSDYEDIDLGCEDIDLGSPGTPDSFEHINLVDDQIASQEGPCVCECHASQNLSQAKISHCRSCSVRFIDGRVYIHSGRTLKPAKVTYLIEKAEGNEDKNINGKSNTTRRSKNSQTIKQIKL